MVFAFDKFCPCVLDHAAILYLFDKKDAKLRLIGWLLLLQEFAQDRDKRKVRILMEDHQFQLEIEQKNEEKKINETFPDELLLEISVKLPLFADIANFSCRRCLSPGFETSSEEEIFS